MREGVWSRAEGFSDDNEQLGFDVSNISYIYEVCQSDRYEVGTGTSYQVLRTESTPRLLLAATTFGCLVLSIAKCTDI
jgi:hypothetical protein